MKIRNCRFSFLKVFPNLRGTAIVAGLLLGALIGLARPVGVKAAPLDGNVSASWMRNSGYYGTDVSLIQDTVLNMDCDLELQYIELNGYKLTIQGDSSRRLLIGHIEGNNGGSVRISGGSVMINGGYIEVSDLTVSGGVLTVSSDATAVSCGHSFKVEGGKVLAKNGSNEDCILSYGDINISGGSITIISSGRGIHSRNGNINISGSTSVDVTAASDAIKTDGSSSITISGAKSVKASGNVNGIVAESGKIAISGSAVDARCLGGSSDSCAIYAGGDIQIDNSNVKAGGGDTAICAVGSIDAKGKNTVIKAMASGSRAIRSKYKKINLGSPLLVASPQDGGLSKDKTFIAKVKGGEEPAREVYIEAGVVVKFDGNGVSMYRAPAEQVLAKGSRITEPDPAPMAAGKVLDGWCKDPDGKNQWNFYRDTVSSDITLYANWLGPRITTTSLDAGKVGKPYSVTLTAKGADRSASWKGMAGNLPYGLSMSGSGEITGVPLKAGKYTFKVAIKDGVGYDVKDLTIEIKDK